MLKLFFQISESRNRNTRSCTFGCMYIILSWEPRLHHIIMMRFISVLVQLVRAKASGWKDQGSNLAVYTGEIFLSKFSYSIARLQRSGRPVISGPKGPRSGQRVAAGNKTVCLADVGNNSSDIDQIWMLRRQIPLETDSFDGWFSQDLTGGFRRNGLIRASRL
jgi:hypothetical protein